jgi:uncharacterized protein YggU (UPF0235/DUF167 family)
VAATLDVTSIEARPWRTGTYGLRLLARVTPRSAREGVEGVAKNAEGPALRVRVRAVAEDGRANRAVEAVVAEWLGVAKSSVTVVSGAKSRIKTLAVAGDVAVLVPLIRAQLAGLE